MPEIKKRPLGRTGFEVSELGLGTWPLGGTSYDAVGEDDAIACIETYLDAGGNFIDTASNKAYGLAQFFIGKVLAKRKDRKNLFIASKTPNSASLDTLPNIQVDLEESLRVMGIDYLDLYYLHWPPSEADVMNRILDEYERFKAEGKIRAIGASIKGPSVTQETLDLCRQYIDTGRVDVIQVVYSMFRQMNKEIFDYAVGKGVGHDALAVDAQARLAANAPVADAAGRTRRQHHRVARRESLDMGPQRIHDAGGLVPDHDGHRRGKDAVDDAQIRVAEAAVRDLHPHLAGAGLLDLDVVAENHGLAWSFDQRSFHESLPVADAPTAGMLARIPHQVA